MSPVAGITPGGEGTRTVFDASFISTDLPDTASADFASTPETRWCLLELPKEQLAKLENGGLDFRFQAFCGDKASEARLCSDTSTFSLEFLENSNSLLVGVLEGGGASLEAASAQGTVEKSTKSRCRIFAQCQGHLSVKTTVADSQHVRDMLQPHGWGQEAAASSTKPVTSAQLAYEVAASPQELQKILADGPYMELEGSWHRLPEGLAQEVVDIALSVMKANGLNFKDFLLEDLLPEVQSHFDRGMVVEEVLRKALQPLQATEAPGTGSQAAEAEGSSQAAEVATAAEAEAATATTSTGGLALDPMKVQQFHALQLLRQNPAKVRQRFQLGAPAPRQKRARVTALPYSGREPPLSPVELAAALQELTGEERSADELDKVLGQRARFDVLDGAVHPLDVSSLPLDVRERARKLFEMQSHWRPDHLSDLFKGLMSAKEVQVWLHKNTRAVFIEVDGTETQLLIKKFAGL
mmetsp:Transcript_47881/g.113778  ORF Transcript_47881/g.113778 Transcript_47881/m.113778 type:complete len:468 (+) Transcript_47881:50-1453(+)|eukprot:CAMPEP_0178443966 /NCGR_PEP_ID=MMETSP0689_2-20121128/39216_1 /TAXON_ID=160604 /ORGANISM="Amphidinium massartii, Strain CS-259" /LENGTH=467 /DNA_ID=CAMNT_0020068087 /DNA_START=46 /DNA_END=1449 /DNA_ORIENTATION=+